MGLEKHEIEMREERWDNLAHARGYRCGDMQHHCAVLRATDIL
jgi:hypothetical protein